LSLRFHEAWKGRPHHARWTARRLVAGMCTLGGRRGELSASRPGFLVSTTVTFSQCGGIGARRFRQANPPRYDPRPSRGVAAAV
jgi:hypothetical protein